MTSLDDLRARLARRRRWERHRRATFETLDDPFLLWMRLATAGMLHEGNAALLERAIAALPTEDPVVEIGAYAGLSTNVIARLLARHERPNRLISTDPWVFEGEEAERLDGSDISFGEYRDLIREQYVRNVRFWSRGRLPEAVQLASDDFFDAWERAATVAGVLGDDVELGGSISLAFVDGDHRYEQARRDFEHVDRWLVDGGFVLFDDSDEFGAFPSLFELVREILAEGRYELVGENPFHLLRKR